MRVLKDISPDAGITKQGLEVMNSLVSDIFERLGAEAGKIARQNKKGTISVREAQTAVRLVIPGELGAHALAEGNKAVDTFLLTREQRRAEASR